MIKRTAAAVLIAAVSAGSLAIAAEPTIQLQLDKPAAKIAPTFYGLMTEEINYSYDGGLYGELVRNRSFKDAATPTHWEAVNTGGAATTIALDQPGALRLDASALTAGQTAGIANDGYWGIPVRPGNKYVAEIRLKLNKGASPRIVLSIESPDGKTVYAKSNPGPTAAPGATPTELVRLSADLQVPADAKPTAEARFVVTLLDPADVTFSFVSLFPPTYKDRPNGNRVDIMQKLVDMKPTFLRFPGGNYLEGDTFDERFDWKKTLGPVDSRPGHRSPWRYRSTDGMGLLEFLQWAEDFGGEPVLAVFAGYALKGQHVPAGPELQPFVDEALEEIEYVTGDASTKWGARRIADGHAAPFPLHYVEVGNEDWFDKSGSYDGRYAQFYDAIKAKYPSLQLIATTKVKGHKIDMLDEHYYMDAYTSQRAAHKYDKRPRDGSVVFVGEWATREGAPTTNLNAALADAAFMTGMERNADIILMSCYAPLFVNVNRGGMQWPSDLIGYDALNSFGSPSYYVQKMFNNNLGDTVVSGTFEGVPTAAPTPPPNRPTSSSTTRRNQRPFDPTPIDQVYYSATKSSATGTVYLKVVNVSATPQPVHIDLQGAAKVAPKAECITLSSAEAKDTNSIADPEKILPVATTVDGIAASFTREFPARSVTILKIETR